MYSMTGYGRAFLERDGRQLTIELKSVNHRFLDLSFKMPRALMFLEDDLRRQIGARLTRGHVDVFITYRNLRPDARTVIADKALFNAYAAALEEFSGVMKIDDRSLMEIAKLPDVLTVTEAEEDQTALRELAGETLSAALDAICAMRAKEGEALKADLTEKIDAMERMTVEIEKRYPDTVKEYTERLKAAVQTLIGDNADENRIMMEVAVMADRSAIAEETVRLHSHIAQMRACVADDKPVGRRMDFIVQELNREVNTISSKSQDIPITNLVVDCKAEIEKLREQVQNVE